MYQIVVIHRDGERVTYTRSNLVEATVCANTQSHQPAVASVTLEKVR